MTYRAAEAVHGMLVEDMTGMGAMRLRHISHARIVDAVVTGDAAIHRAQRRDAGLLHLDAELGEQFAAAIVGGFLAKNGAVLAAARSAIAPDSSRVPPRLPDRRW